MFFALIKLLASTMAIYSHYVMCEFVILNGKIRQAMKVLRNQGTIVIQGGIQSIPWFRYNLKRFADFKGNYYAHVRH